VLPSWEEISQSKKAHKGISTKVIIALYYIVHKEQQIRYSIDITALSSEYFKGLNGLAIFIIYTSFYLITYIYLLRNRVFLFLYSTVY